jgi:LemA protein
LRGQRRFLVARTGHALLAMCFAGALGACGVNTIPTQDEQVKAAWGDVQNQYQRRADLIPNLVATVQGYAQQERDVLTEVTEARANATRANIDASAITDPAAFERFQAAQNNLGGVLGRLLVITENYPDLKSNQNFLALQSQLEGTENRIAISRRDYNEMVRQYNTSLRTFPTSLWAGTFYRNAKPAVPFSAAPSLAEAPTVSFERASPAQSPPPQTPPAQQQPTRP